MNYREAIKTAFIALGNTKAKGKRLKLLNEAYEKLRRGLLTSDARRKYERSKGSL